MYNFFPLFRACLLGAVAAWTLIVLGIAIHFQMSFVDSSAELTYVSLAVFVSAVTLALFVVVLVAPCNKKVSNILRTKWEIVWLGVLAVLWSSLAGYTTTPAAKDSEVECWEEDENGNIVEDNVQGYSNSVYHARYRVLQAFAFINCILLIFFFLFILALAFWHHKRGRYVIWTTPTTSVGWFDRPTGKATGRHLPLPITQRKSHKDERYEKWDNEKETGSGRKRGFKFDASAVESKVKDKFKEKIRPLTHKEPRKESDIENLIAKPLPVLAPSDKPKAKTFKPKEYVVKVPANEAVKPPLASIPPIAAKMKEERAKGESSGEGSGAKRQPSQREKADKARQQARRERNTDEERTSRPLARGDSGARAKRSGSAQPAVTPAVARRESSRTRPAGEARREPSRTRPAVETRREPSQTRPTGEARREPSQTRPDVVRSGSQRKPAPGRESGNNTSDTNASRGRRDTTTNTTANGNRNQSNNPYRKPPGRKLY